MKKLGIVVIMAAIVALAGSAMAFDVGSAVKSTAKGAAENVAKGQAEKEINEKLSEVVCDYNAKTDTISNCDLNKLSIDLRAKKEGGKGVAKLTGTYSSFNLKVQTKDSKGYYKAKESLGNSGWNVSWDNKGSKNKITFASELK